MYILLQRLAEHLHAVLIKLPGKPLGGAVCVKLQQSVLPERLIAFRFLVVIVTEDRTLDKQYRLDELLLVVNAVALEDVVRVDERQDRLEVAAAGGVVVDLDERHSAHSVRFALSPARDRKARVSREMHDIFSIAEIHGIPRILVRDAVVELVIIHPRDRLLPHRVVVDNERLAWVRGIQPGLSVLVGVDELVRRAEYARLLREVYVLSVAVSGSQKLHERLYALARILYRIPRKVAYAGV